jgi:hypothetical protein
MHHILDPKFAVVVSKGEMQRILGPGKMVNANRFLAASGDFFACPLDRSHVAVDTHGAPGIPATVMVQIYIKRAVGSHGPDSPHGVGPSPSKRSWPGLRCGGATSWKEHAYRNANKCNPCK